jgi:hypothetical protein
MPATDEKARDFLFGNISHGAVITVYCLSTRERLASEFRGHGFRKVESFAEIGFET